MKKLRFLNALLIFVIWLSLTGFTVLPLALAGGTNAIVPAAAPAAFGKATPLNGAANQPALGVTLKWNASSTPNVTYAYCVNARPNCPGNTKKWIMAGAVTTATTKALTPDTVYYWQVRAIDGNNNFTEADNGTWWRFKTQPVLGSFGKISPMDQAVDQPVNSLVLQWGASANATSYQYCLYPWSTNTCTTQSWTNIGNLTQTTVYNLAANTIYHWQVRAVNGSGTLTADGGTWWQFTTAINLPSAFSKLSPANTATSIPVNPHLSWSPSAGAGSYDYCIASGTDCTSGWKTVDASVTSVVPSPDLNYNTTYYWQVRAHNNQGDNLANNGVWWSFTTIIAKPDTFSKINPLNGDANQPVTPWLYWSDSTGATSYEYCYTRSIVSACDTSWITANLDTSVQLPALVNDATYYWQVRAVNASGTVEANSGAMWSFTTMPAPPTSTDQTFSTPEDTQLNGQLTASKANLKYELYDQETTAGILGLSPDGSFNYMPPVNYNGTMTFHFTVSDGYNAPVGPYTATITVTAVNDPPVITPLPDVSVVSDNDVTFTVTATDPDLPYGDQLTFLPPSNLPADATFDSVSGDFIWTPLWSNTHSNNYTLTFTVKDQAGLTDQETVHITVAPITLMLPIIMH